MRRLVAIGYDVLLEMHDGRDIEPRGGLLHDPDGEVWHKCSLLVMPFTHSGKTLTEDDAFSRDYFGKKYARRVGSLDTPPADMKEWRKVGAVRRIFYYRRGKYAGDFQHEFGKRTLLSLFRSGEAWLYRRGNVYRIELPDWCHLDDRGVSAP
jgi:hypothetical protein